MSVAFTGVIGFVDLAAPHAVRRIFGPDSRIVIPMSFVYGGAFMALCDLLARTVISPREIPVGAVTALVGAPFSHMCFLGKEGIHDGHSARKCNGGLWLYAGA